MTSIARGRVFQSRDPIDRELLESLNRAAVPNVADAMHGMGVVQGISPVGHWLPQVAGMAVTADVSPGDGLLGRAALAMCRPGDILVINAHSNLDRAVLGGAVCIAARDIGLAAIVVDGAVRDVGEIEELGLPVLARGVVPRSGTTECGWGEVNVPVAIGGVVVMPGDVVMAGREGCVVVPRSELKSVLASVHEVEQVKGRPEDLQSRIAASGSTVPGLDRAKASMAKRGVEVSEERYSF